MLHLQTQCYVVYDGTANTLYNLMSVKEPTVDKPVVPPVSGCIHENQVSQFSTLSDLTFCKKAIRRAGMLRPDSKVGGQ